MFWCLWQTHFEKFSFLNFNGISWISYLPWKKVLSRVMLMSQLVLQLVPSLAHVVSCEWQRGDSGSMWGHSSKVCPKDSYPLVQVNVLIDSTTRHQLLSFMDAFSGYYQIKLDEADQEKTSFSQGLFYYKVMSFGLKNAGATYQRLMNKMFAHQIRRNVQVYVNDMLVKSQKKDDHFDDLKETFDTLRSYNMKLNPNKCAFGVTPGKFLGFMVS